MTNSSFLSLTFLTLSSGTSSNVVVHKEEEKQILMRPPKGTVLEGTMVCF